MTKSCPTFLLPNSYEQYGERGSKFVRDDAYPAWITLAQGQKGDGQMVLPEITTHSPHPWMYYCLGYPLRLR